LADGRPQNLRSGVIRQCAFGGGTRRELSFEAGKTPDKQTRNRFRNPSKRQSLFHGVLLIHSSFSVRNVLMTQPSSGGAFDCPSPLRPSRAAGPSCSQLSYSGSLKSKQSSGNAHKHDKITPV
jgi:hypothetical protein